MKNMFPRVALGVLSSVLLGLSAHAEVKVFKNFSLIDSTAGKTTPASAMVVENGKITWVGPVKQLKVPAKATVTDLTGKFLLPGLIDLHVHIGAVRDLTQDQSFYSRASVEKDLRQYAAYGVTTVQSLGTDRDVIFDIRKEQHEGTPTYSRVYTAGQGLTYRGGYGGIIGINHPIGTPDEAIAEVNTQADKGADFIKFWVDDELGTMPRMPLEIRKAIIDTAHQRHLRAIAHVFYLEDAKSLVSMGIDGFAHMVRDQPVDQELLTAMKSHGVWQMAGTLSREASIFAFGERAPFLDDPFFKHSLSPTALALLESAERQKTISGNPHYDDYKRFLANALKSFKAMSDSGVKTGFGTDSGPPGRFGGYFDHWELEELVAAGFTPAQALKAATTDAAAYLGNQEIGAVAPGKWADLLVLDANPLVNIRNSHQISSVYIAGDMVPSVRP